jgi:hypothetical protein
MSQAQAPTRPWTLAGEYFENCNCDVVCPCEVGANGPMTARPDQGYCDVFLAFHLDEGRYGEVDLGGMNVVLALHSPGPMGEGNWTAAAYLDERASPEQQEALGAIFSGAAGGPPGALAPLISNFLGAKAVPITYEREGKERRARIPNILDTTVRAVPGSNNPDEEVVKRNAHPLFPEMVQAYGVRTTYTDYDFNWDNTGKCADYASFRWSSS